ncbi:hypothetical protein [Proteiniphilum saccharofermentans]|uniref:hypothetical protein n=1 Tax=Proteiniphilum saccharofermentans TaxID=1642647 RepID=UPI0028AC58C6|nr:hypothetical protein [Proteiniphilum saccharofermentans]
MKSKLSILAALLFFIVTGCDKSEITEKQSVVSNDRTFALTAFMPDDGSGQTRIALTQDEKNIKLTWESGDQLQLCFIQGEMKEKQIVTVKNISPDGKRADFDINVPESFTTGTFDLYGVYGGQGLDETDPSIAVLPAKSWQTYTGLEGVQSRKDVMMTFKATGLNADAPSVSVNFQHIGSLFCVKLKNVSFGTWDGITRLQLTASIGGWAYNNDGDEVAKYDLQAESFLTGSPVNATLLFENNSKDMEMNEINEFWAWYPPVSGVNWPELILEVYNSESGKIATSVNNKAARVTPTATGKAYYFYAIWDGSALKFTDNTFTPPPSIDDLITTGDLMHAASGSDSIGVVYSKGDGKVYYDAAQTSGTWRGEEELGTGTEARIAIDGDGHPHVVYRSTDNKIAYLKHDGTEWSEPAYITTNNAGGCSKPDIDVDGSGYAHITYTDTEGQNGNWTNYPDIMYAVNSSGNFVKTVIYNGYREHYGGADYASDYYNKGSYIAVDAAGIYYIIAHNHNRNQWMGGNDNWYSINIKTNSASGSSDGASSDRSDLYDLEFNGENVIALYKGGNNVNRTAIIAVAGTTASFENVQDITTAVFPHSLSATPTVTAIAGWTSSGGNLFTKYNATETAETPVVKTGTKVGSVNVGGTFYSVYTANTGSEIKIKAVTTGD